MGTSVSFSGRSLLLFIHPPFIFWIISLVAIVSIGVYWCVCVCVCALFVLCFHTENSFTFVPHHHHHHHHLFPFFWTSTRKYPNVFFFCIKIRWIENWLPAGNQPANQTKPPTDPPNFVSIIILCHAHFARIRNSPVRQTCSRISFPSLLQHADDIGEGGSGWRVLGHSKQAPNRHLFSKTIAN